MVSIFLSVGNLFLIFIPFASPFFFPTGKTFILFSIYFFIALNEYLSGLTEGPNTKVVLFCFTIL